MWPRTESDSHLQAKMHSAKLRLQQIDRLLSRPIQSLALFVLTVLCCTSCERQTNTPLESRAYVWQRSWTPAVVQSIDASASYLSGWHILVAETDSVDRWQAFTPDATTLARNTGALSAVFRIDGQRVLTDPEALVKRITAALSRAPWNGLEIDYDCPTRQLTTYTVFVHKLRAALPGKTHLSITTLPTWIGAHGLAELLAAADESVLQVHSVQDPRRGLFDPKQASVWIAAYAQVTDKPFQVALPDYGSRVGWDARGRIVSVLSEQPGMSAGALQEELEANPKDIAALLSRLRTEHPANLTGILWFRLPVPGDRRIWSTRTLESVIRGRPLLNQSTLSVERDPLGAYTLVFRNGGNVDSPLPRTVRAAPCIAADGLAGYHVEHGSQRLSFNRPDVMMLRAGRQATIGWTRCALTPQDIILEE